MHGFFIRGNMRLDKYLKLARIIKRRTVANQACDAGRVSLNGRIAKAGAELKIGDIIDIEFGNRSVKYRVLSLPEVVRKDDAGLMYEILE